MLISKRNYYQFKRIKIFLILSLLIQSCSFAEVGNQLSLNFDTPVNLPLQEDKLKKESKSDKIKIKARQEISASKKKKNKPLIKEIIKEKNIKNEILEVSNKNSTNKKVEFYKPQPYRIIIKLSGANPSAPAETVTRALRQAGIKFEVEKIERFNSNSPLKTLSGKR